MSQRWRVPFVRFDRWYGRLGLWRDAWAAAKVVRGTQYILGPEVEQFERAWARHNTVQHGIGVNSGMDALVLVLKALGVGPGDEVIVPAATFTATAHAVSWVGATPVFVDVDETATLNPQLVAEALTDQTRAVIVVHLYGQEGATVRLARLLDGKNIALIEDAAQAHGIIGLGMHSTAACFSFYPAKNLGAAGDAGMVLTNDRRLARDVRSLRDYGRHIGKHVMVGTNARMDTVQAAVLLRRLPHLSQWVRERQAIVRRYMELGIRPAWWASRQHVFHLLPIAARDDGNLVMETLHHRGIEARRHYPYAVSALAPYNEPHGRFPVAERIGQTVVTLPCYPGMPEEDIVYVARTLRNELAGLI